VDSQLIVVDFSKVKRQIDFQKLTGFTTDTISYYRDDLFDQFSAYLFNYERWGERPLFQLVFLFPENPNPKPGVYASSVEQDLVVIQSSQRYAAWSKGLLTAVSHKEKHTVCGFASTEKYPTLGMDLQWLVAPIEGETTCETYLSKRSNLIEKGASLSQLM
jgi:hypothetical protein